MGVALCEVGSAPYPKKEEDFIVAVRNEEEDLDPETRLGDRISDAAMRAIDQNGWCFTFEDVANRAGVPLGEVVQLYGDSKSALVRDAYDAVFTVFMEVAGDDANQGGYDEDSLARFVHSLKGFFTVRPAFAMALLPEHDGDVSNIKSQRWIIDRLCEYMQDKWKDKPFDKTTAARILLMGLATQVLSPLPVLRPEDQEPCPAETLLGLLS
ncbi:hypothetical protein [Streptomyces sp. NPDC051572]|uniref:TetR/AcrR family transcriptional regulator n=1 Tax=Streptomyces sp. NPDC051572 TaxID=3155802 RepID=UPI00344FE564